MKKIAFILSFISFWSFGQELIPLKSENELINRKVKPNLKEKNNLNLDTLQLPFLEDFSASELVVNNLMFQDSGGTFINNRYCVNPPSFNVASFDGLNYQGVPYTTTNEFERDKCDTLVSAPINLQNKNNVFFSFYWQAQGNAVPQVSADSIHLMFYRNDNTWNKVWAQNGQLLNDFKFESIELDSNYLHSGFKFKFESFGNRSGMYGVWHIDYIYLDDNRTANDSVINDIAFSNTPSSFLEKYWAMPKWHFFNNPSAAINSNISATINNFKNDGPISFIIETNADCIDNSNGNKINIHNNPLNSIEPSEKQQEILGTSTSTSFINSTEGEYLTIENRFSIKSNDQDIGDTIAGTIVDFSTTQNDSLSSFTTLADYYAYDDGSAEQSFRITTQDGIVVQEFETTQTDTLYGISIYYPGNPYQYDSTQIILMVWDSIAVGDNYNADNIIYDERVLISVADSLNGFAYYNFLEPVVVDQKFYIGYRQDSEDDILIGYDINANLGFEPIYFNTNGTWKRFQLNEGALMMRPHFKTIQITNTKETFENLQVTLFPNPAKNSLNFSTAIDSYAIYNLNGSIVKSDQFKTNSIDITSLENGMYFTIIEKDGLIKRAKFIKQ